MCKPLNSIRKRAPFISIHQEESLDLIIDLTTLHEQPGGFVGLHDSFRETVTSSMLRPYGEIMLEI